MDHWASCDSIFGLSELPGATHLLKRKKALLQLRLSTPTSDHHTLETTKSPGLKKQPYTMFGWNFPNKDHLEISRILQNMEHLFFLQRKILGLFLETWIPLSPQSQQHPTAVILLPMRAPCLKSEFCDHAVSCTLNGKQVTHVILIFSSQDSLCSDWSDLSLDTSTYEPDFHKSCSTLSVLSEASTFLPSLPPDSISTSNTRIGETTHTFNLGCIFGFSVCRSK